MFGTTILEIETGIRKLWVRESDLAIKRREALSQAAKAQTTTGAEYLDDAASMERGISELSKLRAAVDILDGSITAARGRRADLLGKRRSALADSARGVLEEKRTSAEKHAAKLARLIEQLSELEGVEMVGLRANAYLNPKSAFLAEAVQAAERALSAEDVPVSDSGTIDAGSVSGLVAKIEERLPTALVPSRFHVEQWGKDVEAAAATDQPQLLRGHMEIDTAVVAGSARPGPARLVPYQKQFHLEFSGGLIDHERSTLTFPETREYDRGPNVYHAVPA